MNSFGQTPHPPFPYLRTVFLTSSSHKRTAMQKSAKQFNIPIEVCCVKHKLSSYNHFKQNWSRKTKKKPSPEIRWNAFVQDLHKCVLKLWICMYHISFVRIMKEFNCVWNGILLKITVILMSFKRMERMNFANYTCVFMTNYFLHNKFNLQVQ